MIRSGGPIVVAVSGGPDSLCLLHVLNGICADLRVELHVAHIDHMLRGDQSAAEAAFVGGVAQQWGLPATVVSVDVPALARATHANLHAAARSARYGFLAQVATAVGAQAVAVAHQAEDQAETVLMHLLRGAGLEGLSGMRPVVEWEEWSEIGDRRLEILQSPISLPRLIRPLLSVTRAEIERYCAEHGLEPRRDPTNMDLSATRNRIRHDLMPRLIEYNPRIVAALGRSASVCAEDHAFVREQLAAVWPALARARAGAIDFDGAQWRNLAPTLQREALRQAHRSLTHGETLGLEHVEQARTLVGRGVGRQIDLPGGVALIVGYADSFTLGVAQEPDGPQLAGDDLTLNVPGQIALRDGWELLAAPHSPPAPPPASPWEVYLDADTLAMPLLVRRRRPGDRLQPAGGRGSRKLQDLFVDAKIPRRLRDAWPVVATPAAIVWVAGLRPAAQFVATPASQWIVRIFLKRKT